MKLENVLAYNAKGETTFINTFKDYLDQKVPIS